MILLVWKYLELESSKSYHKFYNVVLIFIAITVGKQYLELKLAIQLSQFRAKLNCFCCELILIRFFLKLCSLFLQYDSTRLLSRYNIRHKSSMRNARNAIK